MRITIITTDDFKMWYDRLDESDLKAVTRSMEMLSMWGVVLPFPHSSALRSSRHGLRELRIQSGGRPLRVMYGFDPKRQAVLLLGGNKSGNNRFYEEMVPKADRLYEDYLHTQARDDAD
jgi:hypothetical protein